MVQNVPNRGASAPPQGPPAPPDAGFEEFDAPDDLTMDERRVWMRQAPLAFKARTLTHGTALSFERYCRMVVLERTLGQGADAGGADHRGIAQRINTLELQFGLTPCGKPLYEPKPESVPANPVNRFRQHA